MRHKKVSKRKILPDPKYHREDVAKFINYIMHGGKKTRAQQIVYNAFEIIKQREKKNPLEVFDQAIEKASPFVEIRSRRVGGANYQIPFPTEGPRRFTLACRWIISATRAAKGKPMREKLAEELINTSQGRGMAIKKKDDVYRMAQANKAFAHFAKYG